MAAYRTAAASRSAMKPIERRLRALEVAAGSPNDMSFVAQVKRAHARGASIPRVLVHPGEAVAEVLAREGVPDDMPYIARIIVRAIERIRHDDF